MGSRQLHVYSSPLIKIEDTLPISEGNLESLKIWIDLCYNSNEPMQIDQPIPSASDSGASRSSVSSISRTSVSRSETPPTDDMVPFLSGYRSRWTSHEDELLTKLVGRFGHDWGYLVTYFPNRTPRLVKERWVAHVQPSVVKTAWTVEEDLKLMMAVKTYGKNWTPMATMFIGRSPLMLKNRYNTKLKYRK